MPASGRAAASAVSGGCESNACETNDALNEQLGVPTPGDSWDMTHIAQRVSGTIGNTADRYGHET